MCMYRYIFGVYVQVFVYLLVYTCRYIYPLLCVFPFSSSFMVLLISTHHGESVVCQFRFCVWVVVPVTSLCAGLWCVSYVCLIRKVCQLRFCLGVACQSRLSLKLYGVSVTYVLCRWCVSYISVYRQCVSYVSVYISMVCQSLLSVQVMCHLLL